MRINYCQKGLSLYYILDFYVFSFTHVQVNKYVYIQIYKTEINTQPVLLALARRVQ
jgi:hypothetical protein